MVNTSTGRKPKMSNTSTANRKLENVKYVHRQEATKCQIHPQAGSWKISSISTDTFDYKDSDLTINFLKLLIFFVCLMYGCLLLLLLFLNPFSFLFLTWKCEEPRSWCINWRVMWFLTRWVWDSEWVYDFLAYCGWGMCLMEWLL